MGFGEGRRVERWFPTAFGSAREGPRAASSSAGRERERGDGGARGGRRARGASAGRACAMPVLAGEGGEVGLEGSAGVVAGDGVSGRRGRASEGGRAGRGRSRARSVGRTRTRSDAARPSLRDWGVRTPSPSPRALRAARRRAVAPRQRELIILGAARSHWPSRAPEPPHPSRTLCVTLLRRATLILRSRKKRGQARIACVSPRPLWDERTMEVERTRFRGREREA